MAEHYDSLAKHLASITSHLIEEYQQKRRLAYDLN